MTESPTPGWYPDPAGSDSLRWWDGERWTERLQAAPPPPPAAPTPTHPVPTTPAAAPSQPAQQAPVPAQAPKKPWYKRPRWIAVIAIGVLVLIVAASSGGDKKSDGAGSGETATKATTETKPAEFEFTRATKTQVRQLFNKEMGATSGDKPRVKSVKCSQGECVVRYRAKEIFIDGEDELLDQQRKIWKTLFTDPDFQSATLIPYTTVTSVGGKDSNEAVLRVTCDRSANEQIDWDNVEVKGVKVFCDWEPLAKL